MADPRRRRPPGDRPALRDRAEHAATASCPYLRDENLARPWAVPGTPGLEHRIGGLEKEDGTGNISYDPENHERMTHLRAGKVAQIADDIPPLEVDDPDGAELLVLGWGSTYGRDPGGRAPRARAAAAASRRRTSSTSTRSPQPRRRARALPEGPRARAEHGPARAKLLRAEFLVPAEGLLEGPGAAVLGRRDRAGDREEALDGDRGERRRRGRPTRSRAGAPAAATTRS